MTEAELLDLLTMTRTQLDATTAQLIALNFSMVVAIYYFLHRSGFLMKTAVFFLYATGWFVFFWSAGLTGQQMLGIANDLLALQQSDGAGEATRLVLETLSSPYAVVYIVASNAASLLLLIVAFVLLFFWKPRDDEGR